MRRRAFIAGTGSAALVWPLAAQAQSASAQKRVGVLLNSAEASPTWRPYAAAFEQSLKQSGWTKGGNIQLDYRFAAGDRVLFAGYAHELVALRPDAILAQSSLAVTALKRETATLPIVFASVSDPVASGFVANLAHPGGNVTGFTNFEFTIGEKWLQLLKELVPGAATVLVLFNPDNPGGAGNFRSVQAASASVGVPVISGVVREPSELEGVIAAFASGQGGAIIVTPSVIGFASGEKWVALAARNRVPTLYPYDTYADQGGLVSYGYDQTDDFRGAGGYIDRILRGTKPADLPVQAPTKLRLIINLKTAKSLGLTAPQSLLVAADKVIE